MNIHFSDKKLFKNLKDSTLLELEFGSILYGLKNKKSDTDIICIYAKSDKMRDSFLWEHHQLQYKDNEANIDYIFIDLHNFIRNLISGDSTINFELIHNKKLADSHLSYLYENKKEFYSYNVIKSYLGLAKRDLKQFKKSGYVNGKKISHAQRGLISASKLYFGSYSSVFSKEDILLMKNLKENKFDLEKRIKVYKKNLFDLQELRNSVNKKLELRKINNFLNVSFMENLDNWLNLFIKSNYYQSKKMKEENLNIFYLALENGIKY